MASHRMILKEVIRKADILLEVVDARFPDETRNSEVERDIARSKKPFIIVLNKCDLVSKETIEKTKSRLSQIAPTVFVSCKKRFGATMLRHKILETAGIKGRDILVGSLGYPNTGKSSVINSVSGKHKAGTSPISGHTKGVQLVSAGSRIMFMDTPGVIPFGENDEHALDDDEFRAQQHPRIRESRKRCISQQEQKEAPFAGYVGKRVRVLNLPEGRNGGTSRATAL